MAVHRWIGTDGNFGTAGNWSSAAAPGAWAAGDTVLFDGTAGGDVTSGLSQTAIEVARFVIEETYEGTIGGAGTPLVISPVKVIHRGHASAKLYLQGGSATVDYVVVNSDNLVDALTLTGNFTNLAVFSGKCIATQGAVVTDLAVIGPRAYLDWTGSSSAVTRAVFNGAVVNIDGEAGFLCAETVSRPTGFCEVNGGEVNFDPEVMSHAAPGTPNTLIQTGGLITWRSVNTGSVLDNIQAVLYGGRFDMSPSIEGTLFPTFSIVGADVELIDPFIGSGGYTITLDLRKRIP